MNNTHIIFKRIITIILIVLLLGALIVFLYFYLWFKIGIKNLEKQHDKNIEIELQNRDSNYKVFDDYIKNTYGALSNNFQVEVKPDVVSTDTDFDIQVPFMEGTFRIIIDTNNKTVHSDNFYKVLATDPKFNHLYSNWVKKQVGCEDKNIELKFNFSKSIDIKSISSLDNNYSELFKNVKNSYCYDIIKKRIDDLDDKNKDIYVNEIITDIVKKVYDYTGKPEVTYPIWIDLYNNDENNSNIVFSFESDTNNLDIFNES